MTKQECFELATQISPPHHIKGLSEEEFGEWLWTRERARSDTFFLATEILRAFDTPIGRKRLDPKLHGQMCRELDRDEDTLQLYPRDHLKSSFVKFYIARKILDRPNVRVGLFSRTANRAYSALEKVKSYFQNKRLLFYFPEFDIERKMWLRDTQEKFTIMRDGEDFVPDENAIEAWGVGGTVVGSHYDVHVYDDIIDQTSVRTVNQMERVEEWWSLMQPIKDPYAIDKVIGTTYHHNDIYQKIKREKWYKQQNVIIRSVETAGVFIYSFYNRTMLKKKTRGMRNYDVSCQWYNNPLPDEDQLFLRPYPQYREEHAPKQRVYYIAVDPALSKHSWSDSTGISVGFTDAHAPRQLFVEHAAKYRLPSEKLADKIIQLIVRYNPRRTGIETGLQEHLLPLIEVKIREYERRTGHSVSTRFVKIGVGKTPKPEKLERTVGAFCRDNRMLLKADEFGNYSQDVQDLVNQMEVYNPNFESNEDDVLDSASMLIQSVERFAPAYWMNVGEEMAITPALDQFLKDRGQQMMRKPKSQQWGWQFAG